MSHEPETLAAPQREALVQIAGGLAPVLSDLLTVIRGQAGRLLDRADPDAASQEPLRQIYHAAERAGCLLRDLQICSGQLIAHAEAMDLNALVQDHAEVLRRVLGTGIAVEFRLAAHLPPIVADRNLLEQLLLIFAFNARDAMPAGGRLLVATGVVEIAAGAVPAGTAGRHGTFVVLEFADSGTGIAPETLPRIFEPFFTTKAGGRSTGLGLAAAFGIVRQHDGWIAVESTVAAGARFRALLPAAPADAVVGAGQDGGTGEAGGNETILFVEDEAPVRDFIASYLAEQGYRVLQAASGPDALEVWQWHGRRVRLLLTDMVLEDGMNGLELAARLRVENPALKVICTSGHTRETMRGLNQLPGGCHFLQKPCRPETLLAAIRTLLDAKPR